VWLQQRVPAKQDRRWVSLMGLGALGTDAPMIRIDSVAKRKAHYQL